MVTPNIVFRTWAALSARRPETLLMLLAAAMALGFSVWLALLNNFVVERAGFTGLEIGILQSLREVPGFLAFTTVFVLLVLREQHFALIAVALLGLGVMMTGYLPSEYGLYFTTVLMSIGFHYYHTLQQSLTLQWIDKDRTPVVMGRLSAVGSVVSLIAFGGIWLAVTWLDMDYALMYLIAGGLTLIMAALCWRRFPLFAQRVAQHRHLVLRRRYGLYYALTFMSGARRQIFVVFAGFLMVERFGYSAADIAALFLINHVLNAWAAPKIGHWVARFGERRMLTVEYIGLILIFLAYAVVDTGWLAAVLYVIDHLFFAMAIAINTYFQKIAEPADIASTAGVSFTINHLAAVVIPVAFGVLWLTSPAAVFVAGAAMAAVSLVLARCIPEAPAPGNEAVPGPLRSAILTR